MDARARALRTRLSELEAQIVERRAVSQEQALAKAKEDVATAQANVAQLQAQIAAGRQGLGNFSVRFAQARAMEDDVGSIERARREALERLARLEAGQQGRRPAVDLLQPGTPPDRPWRPDYSARRRSRAGGLARVRLAGDGPGRTVQPPAGERSRATGDGGAATSMAGPGVGRRILAPGAAGGAGSDDDIAAGRRSPGSAVGSAPTRTHAAGSGGPARRRSRAGKAGVRGLAARPDDTGTDGAADAGHRSHGTHAACRRRLGARRRASGMARRRTSTEHCAGRCAVPSRRRRTGPRRVRSADAALVRGRRRRSARQRCPHAGATPPHSAMAWLVREGLRFADLPRRFGRVDARRWRILPRSLPMCRAGTPTRSTP